jgi:hypothetical protein
MSRRELHNWTLKDNRKAHCSHFFLCLVIKICELVAQKYTKTSIRHKPLNGRVVLSCYKQETDSVRNRLNEDTRRQNPLKLCRSNVRLL